MSSAAMFRRTLCAGTGSANGRGRRIWLAVDWPSSGSGGMRIGSHRIRALSRYAGSGGTAALISLAGTLAALTCSLNISSFPVYCAGSAGRPSAPVRLLRVALTSCLPPVRASPLCAGLPPVRRTSVIFDSQFMTGRTPRWALEELKAPEAFDEEWGGLCGEDSATAARRPRMSCAGWTTAPRGSGVAPGRARPDRQRSGRARPMVDRSPEVRVRGCGPSACVLRSTGTGQLL